MMLTSYDLPGTPEDMEALGYLHANCGHCHNSSVTGKVVAFPNMALWSVTSAEQLPDTPPFLTAVDMASGYPLPFAGAMRIDSGDHAASTIWYRMSVRDGTQMPPHSTEVVDQAGLDMIAAWIDSL